MALPSKITQPKGKIEPLPDERASEADILDVLGITSNELAHFPIQNACTSRVKTLIPLKDVAVLDGLRPDYRRMEELCERIGSTGPYPYAQADRDRQIIALPVEEPQLNAVELLKLSRTGRSAALADIGCGRNDGEAYARRQWYGDHIRRNRLRHSNPGIETLL